jgi:hypothetical protein
VPSPRWRITEQRSLEKTGFTQEGVLRQAGFVRGDYRDAVIYGLLRAEWPSYVTKLLDPSVVNSIKEHMAQGGEDRE